MSGVTGALSADRRDVLRQLALEKCQSIRTGHLNQTEVGNICENGCVRRCRKLLRRIAEVLNFAACYSRAEGFERVLPRVSHRPNINKFWKRRFPVT